MPVRSAALRYVATLALLACGGEPVTPETFPDLYMDAYCNAPCTGDVSAACYTSQGEPPDVDCDFDAGAAEACVDPENWTCGAEQEGIDGTFPVPPPTCANVCR